MPQVQAPREVKGHASPENVLDFYSLNLPFPGFQSHSDRILARF